MGEDAPPGRIGQGGEGAIEKLWRIFNHLVEYLHDPIPSRKLNFYAKIRWR
jgi:hypothetical protein